jgi:hypothetical protein
MKIVDYDISESKFLSLSSLFQASLHYTASMLVRSNFNTVLHACVEDEMGVLLKDLSPVNIQIFWVYASFKDAKE